MNVTHKWWSALCLCLLVVGCAAPSPTHVAVFDFGPGALQAPVVAPAGPAIVLADVDAPAALGGTALLYRLGYHDAQQLRPYAQARWSMPPALLLQQRLREQLSLGRVVLATTDGGAGAGQAPVLRVELEEFSQLFDSAQHSQALVRVRATLSRTGPRAAVLGQTTLVQQQPCSRADAVAGAQALAVATDAVVQQLDQWLQKVRVDP